MASGEAQSPLKGPKLSASSSSSRNDCDESQWMLLPNNLEISTRSKPSKKQRNKEKLRSFPQENIASNVSEQLSSSPVGFQNFSRVKCNTASWLKDQLVSDKRTRKRTRDSEEVFSDTDLVLPRPGAMNFPVMRSNDVPEHPEDSQRPPSRRSIVENENTKANKDECKKNEADSAIVFERLSQLQDFISEATSLCQELEISDEPVMREEFGKIKQAMKHVVEGEREHKMLLQQMASENGGYVMNGISPSSSGSKTSNCTANMAYRDSNGSASFGNEEEHANKCNHLLEKMKQSEERLLSLKMQESLLYNMQKKAENKLASFQAVNVGAHDGSTQDSERLPLASHAPMHPSSDDQELASGGCFWNAENGAEQRQWTADKSQGDSFEDEETQLCSWKEPQDIKQLHVSLERIRKRVQSMQQNPDIKNMTRSLSSDDCEIGERVAAVEYERKKLKNKLVELQEKKKMNDELLQELCYLKDASHAVPLDAAKNDDGQFVSASSRSSQCAHTREKKRAEHSLADADRKLYKLQTTLRHLEGMMKAAAPEENIQSESITNEPVEGASSRMDLRNIRSGTCNKRDNVRKEINSGFPARRHYEAEGRANEDADIPPVPAPSQPPTLTKWSPDIQEKLRKLQVAEKHVKVINDIMTSIREAKKSGRAIGVEQFLSSFERDGNDESEKDPTSSDSDEGVDYESVALDSNPVENFSTHVKEVCSDADKSALQQVEIRERTDVSTLGAYNTEFEAGGKKDFVAFMSDYNRYIGAPTTEGNKKASSQMKELATFQSQLQSLMQISGEGRNVCEDVRSSGEGGYVPNRNSESSRNPLDHVQPVRPLRRHQDNLLLTRQNIATMESQNQSCSRNLHNRGQSTKKDNINNLSGKMEKLSIQNSVNDPFFQIDVPKDNLDSVSTLSSELNQSRSGEAERKTILDIIKRGRKKQAYDRNQDNQVCSNSSIDSEPLECSNSALAVDTTVAATWGGSSTQENFEDENEEPPGNLLRQHRVDGASGSSYQPVPKAGKTIKMGPLQGTTSGSSNELPNSVPCSGPSRDYQQQISSHFIQQLKKQINQLNALCQEELLNEGPQSSVNFHQNSNPNLMNPCHPVQAAPEIVHPYNQQLLLCLSQCYHTLYMQQLEIQHLHRCIRHNIDSEVIHQANNLNSQGNNGEDFEFRPWCMSTCSNPLMPSSMYPNEQVSPRSSAPYFTLPMKPYPPHSAPVTGTRPVRAVIHPASQENRAAEETLNNQVPPRTRANNFWDNFRSYSRQNLLSTSNTAKRNENIGLPVAPQIRQVHPMVSNGNINTGPDMTNTFSSSFPAEFNRPIVNPPERLLPNLRHSVISNPSKKSNSSVPSALPHRYFEIRKKESSGNMNSSGVRNVRSEPCHGLSSEVSHASSSNPSSVNLVQLYPTHDESKVGNFSSICPTSATESGASHSTSDVPSLPQGEFEYHSDFLFGLYREAKALKSDIQRQQALKMIRDIAKSEKTSDNEQQSTHSKVRNDAVPANKSETTAPVASAPSPTPNPNPAVDSSCVETSVNTNDAIDADKPASRLSENNLPWTNQNLPTAAISPLSKQVAPRSASTGAVRKKPKLQSTWFWDTFSSPQSCPVNVTQENETAWEDFSAAPLQPIRENHSDFPGNVVENIILDLQSTLPFGQMREDSSASFWSSINAYIISRIRAHMNVPLPHKALASLRQSLDNLTSQMKFCYCEADFMKCISPILYISLTGFMSTRRFTSSPPYAPLPDGSSVLEPGDKTQLPVELSVKMPMATDDKTRELSINMPVDDVFLPQFQTVLPQNVILRTTETEDNINTDNIQPICAVPCEEEVGCEWGPEAEAEPEVEAGTEADLAEADQSPGQQGNITNSSLPVADSWSVDQATNLVKNVPTANNTSTALDLEVADTVDDGSEMVMGAHCCPDSCGDQEIVLDDVPTKLCPSEEEPQKLEEQSGQLSSTDDAKENGEISPESNNSESEVTSTK